MATGTLADTSSKYSKEDALNLLESLYDWLYGEDALNLLKSLYDWLYGDQVTGIHAFHWTSSPALNVYIRQNYLSLYLS